MGTWRAKNTPMEEPKIYAYQVKESKASANWSDGGESSSLPSPSPADPSPDSIPRSWSFQKTIIELYEREREGEKEEEVVVMVED